MVQTLFAIIPLLDVEDIVYSLFIMFGLVYRFAVSKGSVLLPSRSVEEGYAIPNCKQKWCAQLQIWQDYATTA